MLNFLKRENGNVTVMLVVLLPVFLWCLFFFESKMQARWIYTQTQSILDFSTLAGASTGEGSRSTAGTVCSIPYNTSDTSKSGQHVAVSLFKQNIKTLPQNVQTALLNELNSHRIVGLEDRDLQMSGYMQMKVSFKYKPNIPIFFSDYVFNIESVSRCSGS